MIKAVDLLDGALEREANYTKNYTIQKNKGYPVKNNPCL